MKIGYKDDELFLLSTEEYKQFQKNIPAYHSWWWLRSQGAYSDFSVCVFSNGKVDCSGTYVNNGAGCICPAMIYQKNNYEYAVGAILIKYHTSWVCIGNLDNGYNLFIAETPIIKHRWDKQSNNYETSEIRKFLKNWARGRS